MAASVSLSRPLGGALEDFHLNTPHTESALAAEEAHVLTLRYHENQHCTETPAHLLDKRRSVRQYIYASTNTEQITDPQISFYFAN